MYDTVGMLCRNDALVVVCPRSTQAAPLRVRVAPTLQELVGACSAAALDVPAAAVGAASAADDPRDPGGASVAAAAARVQHKLASPFTPRSPRRNGGPCIAECGLWTGVHADALVCVDAAASDEQCAEGGGWPPPEQQVALDVAPIERCMGSELVRGAGPWVCVQAETWYRLCSCDPQVRTLL